MRHIPNALCMLRMLLVVPVAWLLIAGRVSADVVGVRVRRRRPTGSMAFSPSAAAGPRSSARFSIRSPTRSCWSACSSRWRRSAIVPMWLAVDGGGARCDHHRRRDHLQRAVRLSPRPADRRQQAQYAVPDPVPAADRRSEAPASLAATVRDHGSRCAGVRDRRWSAASTTSSPTRARRSRQPRSNAAWRTIERHASAAAGHPAARQLGVRKLFRRPQSTPSSMRCSHVRCAQANLRPVSGCTARPRPGKTHLLQALCARAGREGRTLPICRCGN